MPLTRPRLFLILSLLTLAAHGISLRNQFVWDDERLIVRNQRICNFGYLSTAFLTDLFQDYHTGIASHYRPLQTASYMADYFWSGLQPFGYHLTNVMLHLLCVVLLAQLVISLTGHHGWALGAAALWAVHPAHTNAVAYVAGRADPLALAGMLGTLLALHAYRQTGRLPAYLLAVVTGTAALFSRENALLLPALVALTVYFFGGRRPATVLRLALPFVVLALAFAWWRHQVLTASAPEVGPLRWTGSVTGALAVFGDYVRIICWPAHLQMERGLPAHGLWTTGVGAVTLAALGAGVAGCWRRRPVVAYGLLWFAVSLAPFLGLIRLNAAVAEHWLYVPLVGLSVALVAGLPARRWVGLTGVVVVAVLVVRSNLRHREWATPARFYTGALAAAPTSPRLLRNYAAELARAGNLDGARRILEELVRQTPADPLPWVGLAWVHERAGNMAGAEAAVAQAMASSPDNAGVLLEAARVAAAAGRPALAERAFLKAMSATSHADPRLLYARWLLQQGRYRQALAEADDALRLQPGNPSGHNLRGAALAGLGREAEAVAAFEMARRLDRHDASADRNLWRLAVARGDWSGAEAALRSARRRQPNDPQIRYELGRLAWRRGDRAAARREFEAAQRAAPGEERFRRALEALDRGEVPD